MSLINADILFTVTLHGALEDELSALFRKIKITIKTYVPFPQLIQYKQASPMPDNTNKKTREGVKMFAEREPA